MIARAEAAETCLRGDDPHQAGEAGLLVPDGWHPAGTECARQIVVAGREHLQRRSERLVTWRLRGHHPATLAHAVISPPTHLDQ